MLATGPAGAVGVHSQVGLGNLHVDVVFLYFREDEDRGEGGVAPGIAVKRGDAYQSVDPRLRLQVAVAAFAADCEGYPFDPSLVAGLVIGDVGLPAAALAVAEIHPEQHLRPVLRLGPASPGIDGNETGTPIVRAGKHPLELDGHHRLLEGFVELVHLFERRFVPGLGAQFDEHLDVLGLTVQAIPAVDRLFHGCPFLQHLLRSLIVVPETGSGNARLQFLHVFPLFLYVKETPRVWRSARRALRFVQLLL